LFIRWKSGEGAGQGVSSGRIDISTYRILSRPLVE
jgi:hypothetical protein